MKAFQRTITALNFCAVIEAMGIKCNVGGSVIRLANLWIKTNKTPPTGKQAHEFTLRYLELVKDSIAQSKPRKFTTASVNKALAIAGFDGVKLYSGNGYWYFGDGEATMWKRSAVCVYRLNDMTIDRWVAEAKSCKEAI